MRGPCLGPLYRFMSLHPRDSVRAVPPYVSLFLRHLAAQISECRHHDCSMKMFPDQLAPRVDAQASSDRTRIGGWFPHVDQSGQVNVKLSRWFSLEITRDEWPWMFEKSSKPALIISPREALAVVVALKVYYGETPRSDCSSIRIVPTTTENRGNGAALNKLMTTKYPASAVLMELAAYSKKMGLKTSVEWSPREANREADVLANGELSQFTPELRIPVDSRRLQWTVLRQALSHGKGSEGRWFPANEEEEEASGEIESSGSLVMLQQIVIHVVIFIHAPSPSTCLCWFLLFLRACFSSCLLRAHCFLGCVLPLFPLLCIALTGMWYFGLVIDDWCGSAIRRTWRTG